MGTHVRGLAMLFVVALLVAPLVAFAADEPAPAAEVAAAAPVTACDQAVTADPTLVMGVVENAAGNVYYYDERRPEAWVTLGTRQGLRPQAVVSFMRDGLVVAQGCVTEVKISDCIIAPAPGTAAGAIMAGDDVVVLVNGTREAMDAQIAKEHRDRAIMTFLSYLALVGDIYIWN